MANIDLSVIIVNYNVKHFLDQCLQSVIKASKSLNVEIIVVDNQSIDGSVMMLRDKYPNVKTIARKTNDGFSVANNEGINSSKGRYVLLLNPDTIVQEDTFKKCLDFMDAHENTGALGVKMIDGAGEFLPESKRGYPSMWASFCKLSGLGTTFSKSTLFNRYYLGHIHEDETSKIDVLCGAFMMMRKTAIDKVGLLDEAFFMYGEDIDLSYRITKAGFDIYYFPETRIIHYKGESTKKASLNYVSNFYNAMIIFSKKHNNGPGSILNIGLIKIAVFLRAMISIVKRLFVSFIHPILDFILAFAVLFTFKAFWAKFYYGDPGYYDQSNVSLNIGLFAFIWVFGLYIFGNYDKRTDLLSFVKGISIALLSIIVIYAFLPDGYRPSRAMIVFGSLGTFIMTLLSKLVVNYMDLGKWTFSKPFKRNVLIIAVRENAEKIKQLLNQSKANYKLLGVMNPSHETDDSYYLNSINQLEKVVDTFNINEIIFSTISVDFNVILQKMIDFGQQVNFKIASTDSQTIVGSQSKNTSGELFTYDLKFTIDQAVNRRIKFISNLMVSIIALIASPLIFIFSGFKLGFLKALIKNLSFQSHWVGYDPKDDLLSTLPKIAPGIIPVSIQLDKRSLRPSEIHKMNSFYATNYGMFDDLRVLLKYLFRYYSK